MIMKPRFITNMMLVATFIATTPASAGDKALEKALRQTPPLPLPVEVRRRLTLRSRGSGRWCLLTGFPWATGRSRSRLTTLAISR